MPYLGHVVSKAGIRPEPAKIEQVQMYPVPTDVTKVRQFVGLASYYRKFIPDFATIARPLHLLTRKNVGFEWTPACSEAFQTLKCRHLFSPIHGLAKMKSLSLRLTLVAKVLVPFSPNARMVKSIQLRMLQGAWTNMNATTEYPNLRLSDLCGL